MSEDAVRRLEIIERILRELQALQSVDADAVLDAIVVDSATGEVVIDTATWTVVWSIE